MSTPQDVQAKLDAAVAYLKLTTASYKQMVQNYGSDWTKWSKVSNWYLALSDIAAARLEVGGLTKQLTAGFKETSVSFTVNFTDQSNPGPSGPITAWHWDFGDGGNSTSQNPSHVYSAAGIYTVVLTVTGTSPDGTNLISLPVTVVNPVAIKASFTESDVGLAATFTDTSTPGPSGPITGWAWSFGDGNTSTSQNPVHTYAAEGTYNASLTVTGTSPDGTSSVTNPVTVLSGGTSFISVTNAARPAFTPTRTVNFSTKAGLDAAIADMQAGDLIKYNGTGVLTISSSSNTAYSIHDKHPSGPVVIDFGCSHNIWDTSKITPNYVAFRYTSTASFAAIAFNNVSNLRVFGGDFSTGSSGGVGVAIAGATHDCFFWDMYSHDNGTAGSACLPKDAATGANAVMNNISIRIECVNWGQDPSADSHCKDVPPACGTGLHGLLTADAGGAVTNCTFIIHGSNPTTVGSCFEIGSQLIKGSGLIAHNTIYVKADHFHFHLIHTASNAINLWGDKDLSTNVFGWIEGNDLYGCVMHTSASKSATTGMVVNHGRHSNTNLDPSDGVTVPYMTGFGIVYNDCT